MASKTTGPAAAAAGADFHFLFIGLSLVGLLATVSTTAVMASQSGQLLQQHKDNPTKLICYYTNWSQYRPDGGKFLPENLDIEICTHVVYSFAKLENGVLAPYEWNDDSTPWMKGMYERVNDLKKQKPELRTLLAVGGWNLGSLPFSEMVATQASRQKFALHAVDFLRNRSFDGLEMDWEYPGARGSPPGDKQKFTMLLKEVREVFDQDASRTGRPRLLFTTAVAAGKDNIDNGYEIDKIAQYVDWLALMAYDLHGSWENVTGLNSPLYPRKDETGLQATLNQDWAVRYWLSKGAPRDKLLLGLATYGRSFTLQNARNHSIGSAITSPGQAGQYTREGGFLSLYEICKRLDTGWVRMWQDEQKTPYAYHDNQWVGYDDAESITIKAHYIQRMQLGGAVVWSTALDDFTGQFCGNKTYPLINTVYNILQQPPKAISGNCSQRSLVEDEDSGRSLNPADTSTWDVKANTLTFKKEQNRGLEIEHDDSLTVVKFQQRQKNKETN